MCCELEGQVLLNSQIHERDDWLCCIQSHFHWLMPKQGIPTITGISLNKECRSGQVLTIYHRLAAAVPEEESRSYNNCQSNVLSNHKFDKVHAQKQVKNDLQQIIHEALTLNFSCRQHPHWEWLWQTKDHTTSHHSPIWSWLQSIPEIDVWVLVCQMSSIHKSSQWWTTWIHSTEKSNQPHNADTTDHRLLSRTQSLHDPFRERRFCMLQPNHCRPWNAGSPLMRHARICSPDPFGLLETHEIHHQNNPWHFW